MCIYYVYIGISLFLSELKWNVFVVSYEELKYFINEVYWSWITTFIYSYLFLSLCNFYRLGPNSHINMKFCLGLHYSKWNIYHTNVKNISFSILKNWYFDIPYINFYYIYILPMLPLQNKSKYVYKTAVIQIMTSLMCIYNRFSQYSPKMSKIYSYKFWRSQSH